MRRVVAVLSLVLVWVITPAPAFAAPPTIDRPGVVEVDFDVPAGALCEFPLQVHLRLRPQTITFLDGNGDPIRIIVTGRVEAWVTNPESGITVYLNIPGPSFLDGSGQLVRGTGPWSGIVTVDGTAISAWGHITFDEAGLVTEVRGRVEELCPQLV